MASSKRAGLKGTKEPVFIIRPASKRFGLDNLDIALMALVIIPTAFASALSTFKQGPAIYNCPYGIVNSTNISSGTPCMHPKYNKTQVFQAMESMIASYSSTNTSLALLPYYSLVNESSIEYVNGTNEWLAVVPYIDPQAGNRTYYLSMLISGENLTLESAFLSTLKPASYTKNSAVSEGAVSIYGASPATDKPPYPVYLVTDPYASGAFQSIFTAINASSTYGNVINMSYYFVFTPEYALRFYNSGFGVNGTQALGYYLACASKQPDFFGFMKNLSIEYVGTPLSNLTLYQTAVGSGLNMGDMNSCFGPSYSNVTQKLDNQLNLIKYYAVTDTPIFIVNEKYFSLPQTLGNAIGYVDGGSVNLTKT